MIFRFLTYIKYIFSFLKKHYILAVIAYAVLASFGIWYAMQQIDSLKADKERLETNEIALTEKIDTFKTESGKNAAKVTELNMTIDEFKKTCADQAATIKDLNLKVKRLEFISTSKTETVVETVTTLRDTVIVKDTINIPAKTFAWSDNWNKIDGTIYGDTVECKYQGIDTLTIVATRVPKKFLFFRWGCKYIEIDAVNANPSTRVTYNRTIKIKK